MANYYESARTNYFAVKDVEAFKKEIEPLGLEVVENKDGKLALLSDLEEGFPYSYYDEEIEDSVEVSWNEIFKQHLQDEEVAILMGAGAEKLRYISGWAVAYNNKGEQKSVSLDDIYELASSLGKNVTKAEY
jgi:hypothetical protein